MNFNWKFKTRSDIWGDDLIPIFKATSRESFHAELRLVDFSVRPVHFIHVHHIVNGQVSSQEFFFLADETRALQIYPGRTQLLLGTSCWPTNDLKIHQTRPATNQPQCLRPLCGSFVKGVKKVSKILQKSWSGGNGSALRAVSFHHS